MRLEMKGLVRAVFFLLGVILGYAVACAEIGWAVEKARPSNDSAQVQEECPTTPADAGKGKKNEDRLR